MNQFIHSASEQDFTTTICLYHVCLMIEVAHQSCTAFKLTIANKPTYTPYIKSGGMGTRKHGTPTKPHAKQAACMTLVSFGGGIDCKGTRPHDTGTNFGGILPPLVNANKATANKEQVIEAIHGFSNEASRMNKV